MCIGVGSKDLLRTVHGDGDACERDFIATDAAFAGKDSPTDGGARHVGMLRVSKLVV